MKKYLSKTPIVTNKSIGMLLNIENLDWLSTERKKHRTADQLGKEECQKCGFCCLRRTCIPTLKEFKEVAHYLGITPKELAEKYSVVDTERDGSFHIKWANEAQLDLTGTYPPYNRTYDKGYCIFFDKETLLCKIYPVRPLTAHTCKCWEDGDKGASPKWAKRSIYKLLPNINLEEE